MFGLFGIASIISTCIQGIKEACTPSIPAENWANKDLYYKDLMAGMTVEERMKNVKNGRYKIAEKYPEPHHLVPMSQSESFSASLDREQNIICLCSNWHNEIHYGKRAKELVTQLCKKRKGLLKSVDIDISLDKLLSMY